MAKLGRTIPHLDVNVPRQDEYGQNEGERSDQHCQARREEHEGEEEEDGVERHARLARLGDCLKWEQRGRSMGYRASFMR